MKTTLTLEDVERLERKFRLSEAGSVGSYIDVRDEIYSLLPLILPVIREHVKGNPEGLRPPAQASLDQGTDVPPAWRPHQKGEIIQAGDEEWDGWQWTPIPEQCYGDEYLYLKWRTRTFRPLSGGTSAHPGSHSDSGQSKAAASQIITGIECDQNHGKLSLAASQKTAQE